MRLHLEKAPKATQFYNIYSRNNDLLNTYTYRLMFGFKQNPSNGQGPINLVLFSMIN